ncbi:MAG: glycosyltransferase family 2 protein [Phycisphaerae bacterium]|nr:glycosyltransferase family 2 protein [Phycisphaerae bacterium]
MKRCYVIVTPAYNEAKDIAGTIETLVRQTVLPSRWVIVDDGSTDDTAAIVQSYAAKHGFIQYYRRYRDQTQTYFASNVYAIMEGVGQVASEPWDFLAVLDADITLPADYYEQIFARFDADPKLGVASGVYENLMNGKLQKVLNDRRSTPKAIQVFRRACFEAIGGYVPLKHGGEDTCACIMARMNGWKCWSFPEVKVIHRRPTGMGGAASIYRARFRHGLCEYGLATHPLFMLIKSFRRSFCESPLLLGGMLRLGGYLYGYLKREPRQMPPEAIRFIRRDQVGRIVGLNRVAKENQVTVGSL